MKAKNYMLVILLCAFAVGGIYAQEPKSKGSVTLPGEDNKRIVNPTDPVTDIEVTGEAITSSATWTVLPSKAGAQYSPGIQYRITPKMPAADKKAYRWVLIDDAVASLTPSESATSAIFTAPVNGLYHMIVVSETSIARVLVVIGPLPGPNPQPVPVPPGPGPAPVPPTPPVPTPVTGVVRFVVVEDSLKADQWRGDIFGSPKVLSFYKQLLGSSPVPVHRIVDINGDLTDPVAAYFAKAAAGKTLPYLFLLDAADKIIKQDVFPALKPAPAPFQADPDAFVAMFDLHTAKRSMGLIRQAPKLKWSNFGDTPSTPLIPREKWKPVVMTSLLGPVRDQDGIGQCASSAATGLMEAVRNQVGLTPQYLSAGDLYSRVNGGRDNGSLLEDNMSELLKNGVALTSSVPYVWNHRSPLNTAAITTERAEFKAVEIYLCPNFDAMASAVQQGFFVEHGLLWYDNFTPDAQGWLPAKGRGGAGGHARFAYGLAQRNGVWGLVTRNSWGPTWGGSSDGTVQAGSSIDPESLFDQSISGFFAVRAVTQTPVPGWSVPVSKRGAFDPLSDKIAQLTLKP